LKNQLKINIYLALVTLIAGCKLDAPILPKTTDTTGGGGTVVFPPAGDGSYQPTTSGSYWIYKSITAGVTDTTKSVIDGNTATFDGVKYYEGIAYYQNQSVIDTSYLSKENHVYINYAIAAGQVIKLYYLNDNIAVGQGWTSPINDSGELNGIPGQFVGSIIEKGISKTVEGKTYKNVIHSRVMLQYDYGSGFETAITYDNYCAQNIGIIEVDTQGLGITGVETLLSYSIK